MCGIVGGITKQIDEKTINKMVVSLKHRGPDFGDHFFDKENNIFLGHTRLSIIGLSEAGHQPMKGFGSKYKNVHIVFNGEVYNYKEIKKELEKKGYAFNSDSDTEVVLYSYIEWGVECVHKFRGMFAFAIWDYGKGKLFLFRDRFGVKPLYYYKKENTFLFTSELKSFYKYPNYKKEINKSS